MKKLLEERYHYTYITTRTPCRSNFVILELMALPLPQNIN